MFFELSDKLKECVSDMIDKLRNVPQVLLRLLAPSGLSEQPRYTPRDLANSVPRIPVVSDEDRMELEER